MYMWCITNIVVWETKQTPNTVSHVIMHIVHRCMKGTIEAQCLLHCNFVRKLRCHGEQLGQLWGSTLKTKPVEHLTTKCLILGFHLNLFCLLEKGHLSWTKLFEGASSFNISCYLIHIIYYLCAVWGQMVVQRENLLLKAKSSMIEHGTWVGDHYMLGFAPTLWFLKSQILCRFYTSCG